MSARHPYRVLGAPPSPRPMGLRCRLGWHAWWPSLWTPESGGIALVRCARCGGARLLRLGRLSRRAFAALDGDDMVRAADLLAALCGLLIERERGSS